ncbi:hypothetical protein SDJN02_04077, partial [Cucurbita argyrosperma subsp. argyrosperma]
MNSAAAFISIALSFIVYYRMAKLLAGVSMHVSDQDSGLWRRLPATIIQRSLLHAPTYNFVPLN